MGDICRSKPSRASVWSILYGVIDVAIETSVVSGLPPRLLWCTFTGAGRTGVVWGLTGYLLQTGKHAALDYSTDTSLSHGETALLLSALPPAPVPGHDT